MQGLLPTIDRITGALDELQLRELLADLAFVNLRMEHRPAFRTLVDC